MHVRRVSVVCLLLALALALTAAACGGGTTTYTNEDYKFSLTYDSGLFEQGSEATTGESAGGESVFDVGFADPNGTKADGQYRDGLMVSVYQLTQVVTDDMLPAVKTYLEETIVPQLAASLGPDGTTGSLTDVEVNGIKGFTVPVTFTMDDVPFTSTLYFLFSQDLEYQLMLQGATSRWEELEPELTAMLNSFTVTE